MNKVEIPTHNENGESLISLCDAVPILSYHCKYKPKAGGKYIYQIRGRGRTLYRRLCSLLEDQSVGGGLTDVALKTPKGRTRRNNVLCTKNQLFEILFQMHPMIVSNKAVLLCPDPMGAIEACDHLFGKHRYLTVVPPTEAKPRKKPPVEKTETKFFVPGITSKMIFEFDYPGIPTPEMMAIFHEAEELLVKFEFLKAGELEGGEAA